MSYRPVSVPSFAKGLNLRDQGDVVDPAEALDLKNVSFTERGGVRSRDGYSKLTSTALTNQGDSIFAFYTSAGTKRLLVGNGARVDAFDTFPGATAANSSALTNTASPHFFTRFGGPTQEAVYIANGVDRLKRYTTAGGFTEPAGLATIAPKFLAVQSPDNRLVAARFVGTTDVSNPSTVRFSAEGDPETFGADDFVQLDPGDGEPIMGIATFRDDILVFKQTKFYVFYGNSQEAGGTVFNFRRIDAGIGLAASQALCTGRDGIYFLDRKGIYKTTGAEPQQVSAIIDPFFLGYAHPSFTSNSLNKSQIALSAMCWHEEKIWLAVPTGTSTANDRVLVHDPRYGWWSLYDFPAAALCPFRPGNDEELVFAASAATSPNNVGKHLCRHSPADAADNMSTTRTGGAAISSRWRSGWPDYGDPNVKTVRETRVWGEGKVEYRLTHDFLDTGSDTTISFGAATTDSWGDGLGTDTWGAGTGTDLWGPARGTQPRLVRQAVRGTVFSVIFSHSVLNESWAIHRLDHHLRDFRVPSVTRSEVSA